MALVPMQKVQIISLKSFQDKVFSYLQKLSAFEFLEVKEEKVGEKKSDLSVLRELEKSIADIEFAIKFLTPYFKDDRGFSYALMGQKEVMNEKRVEEIARQFNFKELVENVQSLEEEKNRIHSRTVEIQKELQYLEIFSRLDISLDLLQSQTSIGFILGRVKTVSYDLLKSEISSQFKEVEIVSIFEGEVDTAFYIVVHKSFINSLRKHLQKHLVEEVSLPASCNHIPSYIQSLKSELVSLQKEEEKICEAAFVFAKELPKLKACYDFYAWAHESEGIASKASYTDYTVIFDGWIRCDVLKKAQIELEQLTQNAATIVEKTPEEDEVAPVEIENNKAIQPFEVITRMYGLPKLHELDPTPYLAVFFLIFFGFCLTDALYGIILACISFAILLFMKVPREAKGLFTLVGIGGISTAMLGVVFGGYAGIPVDYFPQWLQGFQFFDTTNSDDIIKIMVITFGLGFVQLWFGTLIAGVHMWKNKEKLKALSLHFSWTVFFALIACSQVFFKEGSYSSSMLIFALVFISLALAYDTKNIFLKLLIGPFNFIQEVIGWGSNILSYARLFALGLATGVIATVFNQIAVIIGGMLPAVINIIVMVFIIAFGHVLNVAINVLGAFIHSARLQFVEFFGKFLEGGGRKFEPFSRKSRYIYIENKS